MKLFLVFLFAIPVVAAMSRPYRKPATTDDETMPGGTKELGAETLMNKAWDFNALINTNTPEPFYWVPIEAHGTSQMSAGMSWSIDISVGESTCPKGKLRVYEISPENVR